MNSPRVTVVALLLALVVSLSSLLSWDISADASAKRGVIRATNGLQQSSGMGQLFMSSAPAQMPEKSLEKAPPRNSDLELQVLSPHFNPTFRTTGAGVELIGTATGPNKIIQISWSSNLG